MDLWVTPSGFSMSPPGPDVDPDTWTRLPGGGRRTCQFCKAQGRANGGASWEPGTCYQNGGGECLSPSPVLNIRPAGWWTVFMDSESATIWGWDGVPIGRDMAQMEAVARAHGEPWDALTIQAVNFMTAVWRQAAERKKGTE